MNCRSFSFTVTTAFALLALTPNPAAPEEVQKQSACVLSETELAERLALSYDQYEDYDDNSETSWRSLNNDRCRTEAARYIHLYVESNRNNLDSGEIKLQTFHEAMMLSWSGQHVAARSVFGGLHFLESNASDTGQFNFDDWNAYLDATIAFLDKNREQFDIKFAFVSDRITADEAGNIVGQPNHPELRKLFHTALSRLNNCFEGSYLEAISRAPVCSVN